MEAPANLDPITPPAPETIKITRPAPRTYIPHLIGGLFAVFAGLVLLGLLLPCFGCIGTKGMQVKALAQAKHFSLALKLFAVDHDGNYPRQGIPAEMTTAPTNSNTAFACLFPAYVTSEKIFGNPLSAYQTVTPDDVIDAPYTGTPRETLQPGENVYSYVMGLNDNDPPTMPLVADGTDGRGHFCSDPAIPGGVWRGERAVVIRLDDSGQLETLAGPADARFIPRDHDHPASNLFDFSGAGKPLTLLDPATGPRRK